MTGYHILTKAIDINSETESGVKDTISFHANGLVDTIKNTYEKEKWEYFDYSEDSIEALDEILDDWLDNEELSEDGKINLIKVFGGYLSIVIQNHFSGKWWHDGKEAVYVLYNGNKQTGVGLTPYSYVVRRINEGESLSEQWNDQSPLVEGCRSERPIDKKSVSRDHVLAALKKNMGDDITLETVFRDDEFGVYFAYIKSVDRKTSCFVHLHDIESDNGTTYFLGDNNNFSLGIKSISKGELREAVGDDIYQAIMTLIAG